MNSNQKKNGCGRFVLIGLAGLVGLCLVLAAVSLVVNARRPQHSSITERLNQEDKARLAEVFHLRQTLGDQVLPGWSQANIPVIVYNEEYLFLVGIQDPAPGWRKIPQGTQLGQDWQEVPGDDFYGQPYYRQTLPAPGVNSQAFTVQVGDHWAASLSTYEWTRITLTEEVRSIFPAPLQDIIPVPLFVNAAIPGSDAYITAILHEAVHAYQGIRAPERLIAAERAVGNISDDYLWEDDAFRDAWQTELNLLNQALRAKSEAETVRLAQAFLDQRLERREAAALSADLIALERQREWAEGIAKYGELSIYTQAVGDEAYQPKPEVQQDREFHNYKSAGQKWDQEVDQIRRMAGDHGDGRFYYAGFAQAVLLDRLSPGWKERLFEDGIWLEDQLAEALRQR